MNAPPPSPKNDISIVSGADARQHVGWPATLRLGWQIVEGLRDIPDIPLRPLRAWVRYTCSLVCNEELLHRIHPYPTDWENFETVVQEIRYMLRKHNLLAAVGPDRSTLGIAGYMQVGTDADRPVVEIRRTVVDKKSRMKGVYRMLADTRLRILEREQPTATIISATRQPAVLRWCAENGFSETDWRTFYLDLKNLQMSSGLQQTFDDRVRRFGWRYFLRRSPDVTHPAADRSSGTGNPESL